MNEPSRHSKELLEHSSLAHSPLEHSPLAQYKALVNSNKIAFDAAQQQAVDLLQQLYVSLLSADKNPASKNKLAIPKGIYLWGKVGRGKTFLMDLFVNSLSSSFDGEIGKRQHFHHFMQDVHTQLNKLSGKSNPLSLIAKQFAKQYKVLCFDEFFVSDIGDAMLLGNLLQYLFELNVVVICTSNCVPQELYRNGLQRDRFLPAIAAIEQHTQVLHLSGEQDHRHRTLTYKQNYFELAKTEHEQIALHQELLTHFYLNRSDLNGPDLNGSDLKAQSSKVEKPNEQEPLNTTDNQITIWGRQINYVAMTRTKGAEAKVGTICFEFSELCQGARSHFDYVEIAKQFSTILLFNVPPMSGQSYERIKARGTEDNGSSSIHNRANHNIAAGVTGEREVVLAPMDDAARRFIALVDECYDAKLNLMITAYVPQSELYNSGTLMFEFERTKSRLVEMASKEYWEQI